MCLHQQQPFFFSLLKAVDDCTLLQDHFVQSVFYLFVYIISILFSLSFFFFLQNQLSARGMGWVALFRFFSCCKTVTKKKKKKYSSPFPPPYQYIFPLFKVLFFLLFLFFFDRRQTVVHRTHPISLFFGCAFLYQHKKTRHLLSFVACRQGTWPPAGT